MKNQNVIIIAVWFWDYLHSTMNTKQLSLNTLEFFFQFKWFSYINCDDIKALTLGLKQS